MDDTSNAPNPPATPGAFGHRMSAEDRANIAANPSRKARRNWYRHARDNGLTRLSFRRWLATVRP